MNVGLPKQVIRETGYEFTLYEDRIVEIAGIAGVATDLNNDFFRGADILYGWCEENAKGHWDSQILWSRPDMGLLFWIAGSEAATLFQLKFM
jgi:hypothetical protein